VSTPILQSIVLADYIYTDAQTGKKVIAGTFNAMRPQQIPSTFNRSTYAYICLTDIKGNCDIEMKYVDLETGEPLIALEGVRVASESPLDSVEIVVEVPPFPIPHPGVYTFEVHGDHVLLGALRITVMPNEEPAA